jgi:hypothetical protein
VKRSPIYAVAVAIGLVVAAPLSASAATVPTLGVDPVCSVTVTNSYVASSILNATVNVQCTRPTVVGVFVQAMESDKGLDDQMSTINPDKNLEDTWNILQGNTKYSLTYLFYCFDMDFVGKEEPYVHAMITNDNVTSGWTDGKHLSAGCTYKAN